MNDYTFIDETKTKAVFYCDCEYRVIREEGQTEPYAVYRKRFVEKFPGYERQLLGRYPLLSAAIDKAVSAIAEAGF